MTSHRNRGAVLLSRVGQTQAQIAGRLSVSRVAVSQWLSAATKPGPQRRAGLLENYGIPITSWDQTVDHPLAKAAVLEQLAKELLEGLREPEASTALERAKVMASVAATLGTIAKLLVDGGAERGLV